MVIFLVLNHEASYFDDKVVCSELMEEVILKILE